MLSIAMALCRSSYAFWLAASAAHVALSGLERTGVIVLGTAAACADATAALRGSDDTDEREAAASAAAACDTAASACCTAASVEGELANSTFFSAAAGVASDLRTDVLRFSSVLCFARYLSILGSTLPVGFSSAVPLPIHLSRWYSGLQGCVWRFVFITGLQTRQVES